MKRSPRLFVEDILEAMNKIERYTEGRAQRSLQMLAGESPVMVKPENHVAYTQCWK